MDSGASGHVAAMRPRSSAGDAKQTFQLRIDTTHFRITSICPKGVDVRQCPSSKQMGLLSVFHKG